LHRIALGLAIAILGLMVVGTGGAAERVDITAMDGVQLIGVLAGTQGPGVVLMPDPNEDRARGEVTAAALATHGFRVLRFDLRGHGASSGSRDLSALDRDLEGAYRSLLARKIRPVFLVTPNTAASIARELAARVPVAGIAIIGEPPSAAVRPENDTPILTLAHTPDDPGSMQSLVRWLNDPKGANSSPPPELLLH
jgi:pimeloyl-ACP methyl ester carboxylesterase